MPTPSRFGWKRIRLAIIPVLLLLLIVLLVIVLRPSEEVGVAVTTARYADLESQVVTSGRVGPVEDFQARASFGAMIEKIDVTLGQKVKAGQMLIELKDPYATPRVVSAEAALESNQVTAANVQRGGTLEERINEQADLSHAQLEASAAATSLEKLQALQRDGAASEAEVRAATRRVQDARTTLDAITRRMNDRFSQGDKTMWKTRIHEAQENLAAANVTLANAKMTTPIAGTVYLLPVSVYDFVNPGADLMHVADLDHLQVRALFDEPDMGKLHQGAPVEIRWEGRTDRIWHGVIQHIPMAATASGVRNVGESIIAVADANGDLPPNTNVTVTVRVDRKSHVVTLPREALHTHGAETFVYRVIDGVLVRTPVRIGLLNLNDAEIVGGLSLTDAVALHAVDNRDLTDGMKVKTGA